MSKKESWRSSSNSIIFSCLLVFLLGYTVECQEERPKVFAAPTGLNALDVDGSNKAFFKIGATRDGITRAIADEVSPGVNLKFPPNSLNDSPAYDDNLIEPVGEEELFIPSIYRNETEEEKEAKKTSTTVTTTRAPPRTTTTPRRVTFGRETLAPTFNTRPPPLPQTPVQLPPAVQTSQPQPPPRVPPAPLPTRPPQVFQTRPPPPPQVLQTRPPPTQFVPQTRPPPPAPVFQTRPPPPPTRGPAPQPQPQLLPVFRPQQPQTPLQPQTLPAFQRRPAPQPFIPQLRPVQQTQPPSPPPPPATTPPRVFPTTQPPQTPRPFQQQPFRPRPRPITNFQKQQQQQQQPTAPPRPLRPFRPSNNRPFRPRQRPQDPTGLRTGFCPFTIFYQSGPAATFDIQQTYTHFASVVSVDQCARTCHEFNCQIALFDSANRHCQFNPGGQASQQSCPAYPSPFLRNNVPLAAVPLKITCITCQRRRRTNRVNGRVFTNRLGQTRRQFTPQVIGRSIANVVHGILIRQPQSVAIGFGPSVSREDSFHSSELSTLSEKLAQEEKAAEKTKSKETVKENGSEKKEEEELETRINSDLIPMEMHKLSSAEASDESKEILSNMEAKNSLSVIDSSAEEAETEPMKAAKLPISSVSSESTVHKKLLHKSTGLFKKTTLLQRISAADKPIESSEDSNISFA